MRFILIILLLFLAILLQTTLLTHLSIFGVLPNLVLIIIILVSLTNNWQKSLISALVGGLLLDLFSGLPLGTFSLSLVIISFIFNFAKFYLFTRINFLVILTAIITGTIFYELLVISLTKFMSLVSLSHIYLKYNLLYLMPVEIIYNLISVIVFYLVWRSVIIILRGRPNFILNQKRFF